MLALKHAQRRLPEAPITDVIDRRVAALNAHDSDGAVGLVHQDYLSLQPAVLDRSHVDLRLKSSPTSGTEADRIVRDAELGGCVSGSATG